MTDLSKQARIAVDQQLAMEMDVARVALESYAKDRSDHQPLLECLTCLQRASLVFALIESDLGSALADAMRRVVEYLRTLPVADREHAVALDALMRVMAQTLGYLASFREPELATVRWATAAINELRHCGAQAALTESEVAGWGETIAAHRNLELVSSDAEVGRLVPEMRGEATIHTGDNLLDTLVASIRRDVARVQSALEQFARFGGIRREELVSQVDVLRKIGDTLGSLGLEEFRDRVRLQAHKLKEVVMAEGPLPDQVLVDLASELLAIESACQGDLLANKTADDPEDSSLAMTSDYKVIRAAVFTQCLVNLQAVKEALASAVSGTAVTSLGSVLTLLQDMNAGLLMINEAVAVNVIGSLLPTVTKVLATGREVPRRDAEQLADKVVALEFYLTERQAGREAVQMLTPNAVVSSALDVVGAQRLINESQPIAQPSATPMDQDPDLLGLFADEARTDIAIIQEAFGQWELDGSDRDSLLESRRALHKLKGSSRMVDASSIGELAWAAEQLANALLEGSCQRSAEVLRVLRLAIEMLPRLLSHLEAPTAQAPQAAGVIAELRLIASNQSAAPPVASQVTTVNIPNLSPPLDQSDVPDQALVRIYQQEAHTHLAVLMEFLTRLERAFVPLPIPDAVYRATHTLLGASRMAGVWQATALAEPLYVYLRTVHEHKRDVPLEALSTLLATARALREIATQWGAAECTVEITSLIQRLTRLEGGDASDALSDTPSIAAPSSGQTDRAPSLTTAVADVESSDQEIRQIFCDEATELLDAAERALAMLTTAVNRQAGLVEMQRVLHTLKGSARMAHVFQVSDLAHEIENALSSPNVLKSIDSPVVLAVLQASIDDLNRMRDACRGTSVISASEKLLAELRWLADGGLPASADSEPDRSVVSEQTNQSRTLSSGSPEAATKDERQELARVDAELLDQLLNDAGEVSIYRARLEQQLSSMDFNLAELARVVQRLKGQLRKLELETEIQMAHGKTVERRADAFDPLELDRFSMLQQYTRALSETSSDVGSLQGLLEGQLREGQSLLIQQARMITNVQNGLMRSRMVPFTRYVPRLTRALRQVAGEHNRQVELVVTGADGELDRQVFERLLPPIEHMLRNAVVHGIESAPQRLAAGKSATGRVQITLRREGAEMAIILADDGAGMDLRAIREKAVMGGFIDPRQSLSDQEAMQLTLEPGFSTAKLITAAAGRGVGMDVVATEIKRLGGTLHIDSIAQQGTTFTIRLPFTLAVSQALIVRSAEEVYALLLPSVEAVIRVPRQDVERHLAEGVPTFNYNGQNYRFQYLGSFVGGLPARLPDKDVPVTILLIRAGERSTALVTDEVMGCREIVIKNIGPQMASIKGIAGATVLGDGRIVVILDMPALIRGEARTRTPVELLSDRVDRRTFVLVVDDSITVRRVTQRVLERNGMRVIAAKDGVEALMLLEEHLPDVILLDIEMPRMDGYEVASMVRATERLQHIPIIMITSRAGEKHQAKAIEIGVNDYLSKPYQEQQLLDAIAPLVRRPTELH